MTSRLSPLEPSGSLLLAKAMALQPQVLSCFGNRMPDALALENAIAMVEDELVKLPKAASSQGAPQTQDKSVREIAHYAGRSGEGFIQLSLDDVERCFNRLAAMAQGSPAAHQGLPTDPEFAAALLILREFMHHRRVEVVTVLGPGRAFT